MKRLNIEERMLIQACLAKNISYTEIAKRLDRNKSTISREINTHLIVKNGYWEKDCCHRKEYILCNACPYRKTCQHEKRYYNFEEANKVANELRRNSRKYTHLSQKQINDIDEILMEQVRELKQSLHHVYASNPSLSKICSEKTIRRLIYNGFTKVRPHELRKYVVYKHEYKKPKEFQLRDISVLIGRQFSNYLKYVEKHKRANIVQYDSVIGKREDKFAILTITLIKYGFQFGILIKKSNPEDVVTKLRRLFNSLNKELVKKIFAINLADNGFEFSYFNKIEYSYDKEFICRTFFTNPYKATDKPHCERYHEFIRYMIPKGKSLDFLTQEKVNWIFSQINSYVRKKLHNQTPYDLVRRKYGQAFLDKIGIVRIDKKKVNLNQIG